MSFAFRLTLFIIKLIIAFWCVAMVGYLYTHAENFNQLIIYLLGRGV